MSEKTPYDPTFPMFREMLGLAILAKLEESGFTLEPPTAHAQEKVYARTVDGTGDRVKIKVFTSVVGTEARNVGYDAIKVAAVYTTKDGKTKGLTKDRRVNRTGNMEDIVDRMLERMRESWKAVKTGECCNRCGAPKFTAKSGNTVCAEICWRTSEEKEEDARKFKASSRKRRKFKKRWR